MEHSGILEWEFVIFPTGDEIGYAYTASAMVKDRPGDIGRDISKLVGEGQTPLEALHNLIVRARRQKGELL